MSFEHFLEGYAAKIIRLSIIRNLELRGLLIHDGTANRVSRHNKHGLVLDVFNYET